MSQESFVISLEPGKYYICSCGLSKNAPYCDGAHKGTGWNPLVLELESPQTVTISDVQQVQPQSFADNMR